MPAQTLQGTQRDVVSQFCYKTLVDLMVEHGINVVINIGIVRLPSQQWLKVGDRAAKYQFEKIINPEFKTFLRNAIDFLMLPSW